MPQSSQPRPLTGGSRPGRLVVVGSGIKGIAHLTLEAVGHLEEADKVFYTVADGSTAAFIHSKNANAIDLYNLYDIGKPRYETYIQMAEKMLREVRNGFYVVGIFYGHPGIFVNPTHRAIAIARQEGHQAFMLPGISAEACLFSDIGVDPAFPSCQTFEATDLLLRERPINTTGHVVIFQIDIVGDSGFHPNGFMNTKPQILISKLQDIYGVDHPIVH